MFSPMIISKENLFIKSIFLFFILFIKVPANGRDHCALCIVQWHCDAVYFFINNAKDSSCTSRSQQWGKQSGKPTYVPNKDLKICLQVIFVPKSVIYLSMQINGTIFPVKLKNNVLLTLCGTMVHICTTFRPGSK